VSKFSIFLIGYLIFVCGVAFALDSLGLSGRWVFIAVLILVGVGIAAGANRTKRDDPPTA
jgi:uncharacterized membrane protein YiaA